MDITPPLKNLTDFQINNHTKRLLKFLDRIDLINNEWSMAIDDSCPIIFSDSSDNDDDKTVINKHPSYTLLKHKKIIYDKFDSINEEKKSMIRENDPVRSVKGKICNVKQDVKKSKEKSNENEATPPISAIKATNVKIRTDAKFQKPTKLNESSMPTDNTIDVRVSSITSMNQNGMFTSTLYDSNIITTKETDQRITQPSDSNDLETLDEEMLLNIKMLIEINFISPTNYIWKKDRIILKTPLANAYGDFIKNRFGNYVSETTGFELKITRINSANINNFNL
jgi:hypothetical protein